MHLRLNQALLQNLTIKHLDVHVTHGGSLQLRLRQGIYKCRLKRLHLQFRRLLLEETFYAHEDGMIHTQMFRHFLVVLEVKLAYQSLLNIRDVLAHLAFNQDFLSLSILNRFQN